MKDNQPYLFRNFSGAVNSELLPRISIGNWSIPGCQAHLHLHITLKGGITPLCLVVLPHISALCLLPYQHFSMQISPLLFEDSSLLPPFSSNYLSTPTRKWGSWNTDHLSRTLVKTAKLSLSFSFLLLFVGYCLCGWHLLLEGLRLTAES